MLQKQLSILQTLHEVVAGRKRTKMSSELQRISPAAGSDKRAGFQVNRIASSRRSTKPLFAGSKGGFYAPWILCAVFLSSCFQPTMSEEQGTELPTTSTPTLTINRRECFATEFDSKDQRTFICRANPKLFPILKYAEQVARKACEEDFKQERWNCSHFSLLKQPNITKTVNVYAESSYVSALSLAVITHTVARACEERLLTNCSCAGSDGEEGCPSNVAYGLHIARTFLDYRFSARGGGIRRQLALHVFRATQNIVHDVMNSTEKSCSCHGISGTCTFSVCLNVLPDFSVLVTRIKNNYKSSCLVRQLPGSGEELESRCNRAYTANDFIHTVETVNSLWCQVNPSISSVGVVGRECNSEDPHAKDSCSRLCGGCGRGSEEVTVVKETQCDCTFEFCCDIKCKTCFEERTFFRCL